MKSCSYCKEQKAYSEFYRNKSSPDGFYSKCKICHRLKLHPYWKREDVLVKDRIRGLEKIRKKNGLPLDYPRMVAPKGAGCLIKKTGYRVLSKRGHPNGRGRTGRIFEHVFIMSNYLGRPIEKHERVHHKNGIRHDNRIENLELWSHSHPPGQRVDDKIAWCKEFLDQYGYDVVKR